MAKRFFAFGCSFTEYCWVTWADILGKQLVNEGWDYYNFGASGIGNQGIATLVALADLKYKFDDDDIVAIVWSSWTRESRWIKDYNTDYQWWDTGGNVLNNPRYDDAWIEKHFNLEHYILETISCVHSVQKGFNINFTGGIMPYEVNKHLPPGAKEKVSQLFEYTTYNNFFRYVQEESLMDRSNVADLDYMLWLGHPTPLDHLKYLTDTVIPNLTGHHQIVLSEEILKWVEHEQRHVEKEAVSGKHDQWFFYDMPNHWRHCIPDMMGGSSSYHVQLIDNKVRNNYYPYDGEIDNKLAAILLEWNKLYGQPLY